jgi:hypothetical protein
MIAITSTSNAPPPATAAIITVEEAPPVEDDDVCPGEVTVVVVDGVAVMVRVVAVVETIVDCVVVVVIVDVVEVVGAVSHRGPVNPCSHVQFGGQLAELHATLCTQLKISQLETMAVPVVTGAGTVQAGLGTKSPDTETRHA